MTMPRRLLSFACLVVVLVGCARSGPVATTVGTAAGGTAAGTPDASATRPATASASPEASATPTPSAPARVDCTKLKCVALTFDDGPGPQTPTLLATLVDKKVPATFFLVGRMIKQHPATARRIAQTPGMTVANHTMIHPMLTRIAAARAAAEITDNTKLIQKTTGVKPRYFRPPYGLHNNRTDAVAKKLGQAVVLWSAGALDWQYDTPAKIVEVTLPQITPGAIVLAHDIHPWTIKAVPSLIAKLRAKGYTLVSLDDILRNPRAGNTYSRGLH
ncbi:MAG: polysaccharide deacetylase family protein [Micropruina sp.]|nr:polysaccharide deacetylase family protein [Micropruina sp.]